jgi:hypothetical protein
MFDKLGLGAAALSLMHGDYHGAAAEIGLALANHTLGSTGFKTRVAAALSAIPEFSGKLFEANPELKTALQVTGKTATQAGRYAASRFGARTATSLAGGASQ